MQSLLGRIVQSAADMYLTADPGVVSSIPARSYTFLEIHHEIISMAILLPSTDSRMVFVSYKRKYVQEVLVNCLVKLGQEKSVVWWTDHPGMTTAIDWDVKNQTKPKKYVQSPPLGSSQLTLYLIETPFNTFANRADQTQQLL